MSDAAIENIMRYGSLAIAVWGFAWGTTRGIVWEAKLRIAAVQSGMFNGKDLPEEWIKEDHKPEMTTEGK